MKNEIAKTLERTGEFGGSASRNEKLCKRRVSPNSECRKPGAPYGEQNGNYKSGQWTKRAIAERREIVELARNAASSVHSGTEQPETGLQRTDARPPRVRLRRVNCNYSEVLPCPNLADWRARLENALGTVSSDFVDAALLQLQNAARLPNSGISECGLNAALALISSAKPANELEAALAMQMACTHAATMSVLSLLGTAFGGERRVVALGATAAKLLRAFAQQVETLKKLKNGPNQTVRVEHLHFQQEFRSQTTQQLNIIEKRQDLPTGR